MPSRSILCAESLLHAASMIRPTFHNSVVLPMKGPERRRTARTTVERFVYINIEPNNAGSVSNVSEGGLCFHSIAPVQANRTIRFWFSEHNRRIEIDGDLAWTDETRKTVGLRFTSLPAEAREPICSWITPPTSLAPYEVSTPSVALRSATPVAGARRLGTKAASDSCEPLGVPSPGVRNPTLFRGFSRGLATGLFVSTLVAAAFLFHSYRRQFGVSLIQLGERVAARSQTQMQSVSSVPRSVLPARRLLSPAPAPISVQAEKLESQTLAKPAKTQHRDLELARPANPAATAAAGPALKAPVAPSTVAISSTRPTILLPTTAVAPTSNVISAKPGPIPNLEPESYPRAHAANPGEGVARSTSGLYLEVGKFKDVLGADTVRDKLTQLGFRATIIQRGRLWMLSYYVLVGPYEDDRVQAERKHLASHGFKPRAFEAGSRNLSVYGGCDTMSRLLRSSLTLNRVGMPAADCLISWESYSNQAIVKFVQDNYVFATAEGRWVNRSLRFARDAFVYRQNEDGSQTLIEIQFAGMSQALVFDKLS
jgi:cell division protein FtsN